MKKNLTVGFIQTNPVFGEKKSNIEEALRLAQSIGGDLLVMPEMFNTGYSFASKSEVKVSAEKIPSGYTTQILLEESGRLGATFVAGLPEKAGDSIFNSAIVVSKGRFIGIYRKLHLFYKEKKWFDPGDIGCKVFNIGEYRLGLMICFDWVFPEIARVLALMGADIIAHPSNLVKPYAHKAMLARSVENRVFTITANRIGIEKTEEDRFRFTGRSQIVTPDMKVIASAPSDRIAAKNVVIDILEARNKKFTSNNDIVQDRRTEFYRKIIE